MISEVDVAIVGAGAAGLAAGKVLQEHGVTFRVLEARSRSGGRAWTDENVFADLGFDHGCHWLHSASINPLRQEADRLRVGYLKQESWRERQVFDTDHWINNAARRTYQRALDTTFAALDHHSTQGRDVSASQAFDANLPYLPAIRHIFSQVTSADPEDVSVIDSAHYLETEEDYPVEAGYGALIQRVASGVDVATDTPVTQIDWSGKQVVLQTPRGDLRARSVIVTSSTNVLTSDGIRFDPELPTGIVEALNAAPLGCVEKVAFLLDKPVDDMPPSSFATIIPPDQRPLYFQINPFGRPMAVAHLSGSMARALAHDGEAAIIAFARERLIIGFGADIAKRIKAVTATGWTNDPYIQGAYSHARPGLAHLRKRLTEPFSDRLFLAGEATTVTAYASAHGAHETGILAAKRALGALQSTR